MLCILVRTKQNLLFPLTKVFSPSLTEYAVGSQQSMVQLFHLVSLVEVNSPFVKRGSGSFLKKDFSKLLITFKSRHFWVCKIKIQYFCSQYHQRKKNNKNQQHRPVIQTEIPKLKKKRHKLTSSCISISAIPLLSSSCILEMAALFPGTL